MKIPIPANSTNVLLDFETSTPPPPVNQLPIVNAGQDQSITLPLNQITLNGTANDPDGTIASYKWEKILGSGSIVAPNSSITQITGLTEGVSVFRLTVTDNDGAESTDDVRVTVNAQATGNIGVFTAVPTFECVGLYWSGHGKNASTPCLVSFKEKTATVWNDGLELWCDSRSIGGRPANEYRGSIVFLKPGTVYDLKLTAGTASYQTTFQTWSEKFPEGTTTNLTSSTNITSGGTSSAYKVFTGSISGGTNNLYINAAYIIIRKMVLKGATEDAIVFGPNAKDVIVEDCDISGWGGQANVIAGNNQAAFRTKFTSSTVRLIIQRNYVHDPRYSATGWTTETDGSHPYGVNAFNFEGSGGNHVIRNNKIIGDGSGNHVKRFMDGVGGADNFTYTGSPGRDSDVYLNRVEDCFDDAFELEGGGMNLRAWNNFMNFTFTGIATATVSVGPIYVFNNVSNVGMRMSYVNSSEDRGPFNKCGNNGQSQYGGGRTYLFHNTVLQPNSNRGLCGGIVESGGKVINVISKNNIWTSAYVSKGGMPINLFQGGSVDSECDLFSPNQTGGNVTKKNPITGTPKYKSTVGLELNPEGYFLADGSDGKGKAVRINNFNDQDGSDIGAYNKGNIKFGV